jgi:SagB-type dehydrogenase family enzyme
VLAARRSLRDFSDRELTRDEVAQLLWSAQGVTSPDGYRTAPSAGALYPLTLYVALPDGVHRYHPNGHRAERMTGVDLRQDLAKTALSESPALAAPALFVVTATVSITAAKYDGLAERYVLLEAGHATQNLLLMAVALGLGGVPLGALDDEATREVLDLPGEDRVIYLVPVGRPPSD